MSAGNCRACGGDGFWHFGVSSIGDDPCPRCDGTGKAGYVRLWHRILRWLGLWRA